MSMDVEIKEGKANLAIMYPLLSLQLKRGTSVVKKALPRIKDVNIIDKYSRVIFPVCFLLFNIGYWCFYTQAET